MPYYRLYLTKPSGQFLRCKDFVSDDDGVAVKTAEDLRAGASAELWQEGRKVHMFDAEHQARQA
jgi:hypothetical protein